MSGCEVNVDAAVVSVQPPMFAASCSRIQTALGRRSTGKEERINIRHITTAIHNHRPQQDVEDDVCICSSISSDVPLSLQQDIQCSVMKFALGLHHFVLLVGMRALHHANVDIHGPNTMLAGGRLGQGLEVGSGEWKRLKPVYGCANVQAKFGSVVISSQRLR